MAETEQQRDVTRRELADELAKSRETNERLAAQLAEMQAAAKVAPPRMPHTAPVYNGPEPNKVPYSGLVRATARCCIGHVREEGEIFEVSVPALWTDDPYIAVIVTGYTPETRTQAPEPIWELNPEAPTPIALRFRKAVSAAEDPTPRVAASF